MTNPNGNTSSSRSAAKVAHGYQRGTGRDCYRRIVISLDDATFDEVADLAKGRGKSFAAIARELIEFGLIDADAA